MSETKPSIGRHYGLDWLRIAAFAILIAYHTAMHVGPLHWVVKVAEPSNWLAYPINTTSPWRLMVLFAVSGYATATMLGKFGKPLRFFAERSKRLLVPLLFGIAVLVPPQSWVRLVTENHYQRSFTSFWLHDDFRFGDLLGHTLPHWEHLWFLGYLWFYTALLVTAIMCLPGWKSGCLKAANWLSQGHNLLFMPILIMAPLRLFLIKEKIGSHGMFDDYVGDEHYIPAFLLGYLLACYPMLWETIRRTWKAAAAVSALAWVILMTITALSLSGTGMPTPLVVLNNVADTAMAWAMVPAALYLADRFLNREGRWRKTLAEAVFPAYLVHQTVIVVLGWYLLRFDLPNAVAFLIIAAAVIASSVLAYWLARRMGAAGILLGVANPRPSQNPQSPRPARA